MGEERDDGRRAGAVAAWGRRGRRLARAAAALLLAALAVTVLLQVVARYVLRAPLSWTLDGATLLLIWVSFLGAAVAAFRREHFTVDFVVAALPAGLGRAATVVANLAVVVTLGALVVLGWRFAMLQMDQVYPTLPIAKGWVALAIPVSAALMIPRYLADALAAGRGSRGGDATPR